MNSDIVQTDLYSDPEPAIAQLLMFLDAIDISVGKCAVDCMRAALDINRKDVAPVSTSDMVSKDDFESLRTLANSKNKCIRMYAVHCLVQLSDLDALPKGKLNNTVILNQLTTIMHEDTNNIWIPFSAIRVATAIAKKGLLWQERLVGKNWLTLVLNVSERFFSANETSAVSIKVLISAVMDFLCCFKFTETMHLPDTLSQTQFLSQVGKLIKAVIVVPQMFRIYPDSFTILGKRIALKSSMQALNALLGGYHPSTWDTDFEKNVIAIDMVPLLQDISRNCIQRAIVISNLYGFSYANKGINDDEDSLILSDEEVANEESKSITQRKQSSISSVAENAVSVSEKLNEYSDLVVLTCMVISILRILSGASCIAQVIAETFVEADMMFILNELYHLKYPPAKLEIASFFEALIGSLDEKHKISLCENGVIIRLLRLASPSAINYSTKTNPQLNNPEADIEAQKAAFIPAIKSLTYLAQVDVIAARIMLAGGLGPLYSHANSNRPTRLVAREALDTMGVRNLNDVIETWITHKHQKDSNSMDMQGGNEIRRSQSVQSSIHVLQTLKRRTGESILLNPKSLVPLSHNEEIWHNNAIVGSGAFSTVYKAQLDISQSQSDFLNQFIADQRTNSQDLECYRKNSGMLFVAVKRFTDAAMIDPSCTEEIRILSKIPYHANITTMFGVSIEFHRFYLISEFGGKHNLSTMLGANDSPIASSWEIRLHILNGIAKGMKLLHSLTPAILHLDLKASNVMVHEKHDKDKNQMIYTPKLCDFGLAVELKPGYEFLSPANHGTLQWMAPEVMEEENVEMSRGFDQTADVFSFAVVMWELAHPGSIPWSELTMDGTNIQERIREIVCSGRRLKNLNAITWPMGFEKLMRWCWRQSPSERPWFVRSFLHDPDWGKHGINPNIYGPNNILSEIAHIRKLYQKHQMDSTSD